MEPDKTLPGEISEIDALTWENLELKLMIAKREYEALVVAYNAKTAEYGKTYSFDPTTAKVNLSTRAIMRP